jgi:hypothetical protein
MPEEITPIALDAYGQKASDLLKTNPDLERDPAALHALASTDGASGHELGQFSKLATLHSSLKSSIADQANASQNSNSWWSDATNWVEGAATGVKDMVVGGLKAANRGVDTAAELGTGGLVGTQGLGNFSSNLGDAQQTVMNVANNFSPSNNFGFNEVKHMIANWETLAARKGVAYALGNITPTILGAMFGGEGLAGAGAEATDVANAERIASSVQKGTATADDLARFVAIRSRQLRRSTADTATAEAKAAVEANMARQSTSFKIGNGIFENPVRWTVGLGARGVKAIDALNRSARMQGMYIASGIQAQSNEKLRQIWNATAEGHPLDAFGRPLRTTAGQGIADLLGLDPGSKNYSLTSGLVDAGALMGGDPYSAIGKFNELANSAEGVGGIMGRWYKGLGVETGADVFRTAGTTSRSMRALKFIADSNANQISKAFRGMFDEKTLAKLAAAHTVDNVVEVLAQTADAGYLTRGVMPTMKIWRVIGRAMRDATSYGTLTRNLADEGVSTAAKSTAEATQSNINIRSLTWARRFLSKNFTEAPWYIEEAGQKGRIPNVKNYTFRAGDPNAIEPLMNMFRMTGNHTQYEIDAMGEILRQTENPQDYMNALYNLSAEMIDGAVATATSKTVHDSVAVEMKLMLKEKIRELIDAGGGGRPGVYSNGRYGEAYSEFRDPEDATKGGFFGHGDSHVSQGKFVDPRELVGLTKKMASVLRGLDGTIIGSGNRLRYLEQAAFLAAAEYKEATVKGLVEAVDKLSSRRFSTFAKAENGDFMRFGYETATKQFKDMVDKSKAESSLNDLEKYVTVARSVFDETDRLERQIASMTGKEGVDPRKLAELQGRFRALTDAELQLYRKVQDPTTNMGDFESWVDELGFHLDEKKQLTKEVKDALIRGLEKERTKAGTYLNRRNLIIDWVNKLQSWAFVPLMLSTGGYIQRIAGAEWIPALLRFGNLDLIEARLGASIAKRMAETVPLQETVVDGMKVTEARVIKRHVLEVANLLHDNTKWATEFLGGALTGVQRGILKGMTGDQFYRMLDDFQVLLQNTGGHIPDVGHASSQLYNSSSLTGAMSETTYGLSEDGKNILTSQGFPSKKFVRTNGQTIVTAQLNNLRRVHSDQKMLVILKDLKEILDAEGPRVGSDAAYKDLHDRLTELDYERKKLLTETEKSPFPASRMLLADPGISTGLPLKDWAKASTYNVLSVVSGINRKGEWVIQPSLIEQALTGSIKGPASLAAELAKMDGAPSHLIDREFVKYPWQTESVRKFNSLLRSPEKLNHLVLDKTFGKLISWVSREPQMMLQYHLEMEELRPRIAQGIINQDQAEVKAMNEALRKMAKFIHNPADRYGFEVATRWYSPFWFAKNQAYRRAYRLLEENPQAFVEFLKMNLYVTNYFARNTQNGNTPVVTLPGSEWLGGFLPSFANLGNPIGNLHFAYAGDVSSLQTVFPLGNELGWPMVGNLLRPDPGTVVSVGLKLLGETGLFDSNFFKKFLEAVIGPVGANTPISSDVLPSSFYRSIFALGADESNKLLGTPQDFSPIVQVEVKAMHSMFDNMRQSIVEKFYEMNKDAKFANPDQKFVDANIYADYEMSDYFENPQTGYINRQKFMDEAHTAALGLYFGKALASFTLPVAASIQEKFSKSPEFNKITQQTLPDGSKIPYSSAIAEFAIKYPGNFLDTVSTSQSPYGPFGETNAFMEWANKAPSLLTPGTGIPSLAAALIPRSGSYYPPAYQSQISMGLRKADTPQQYMDSVLVGLGNDFYYNYLMPTYYSQYGTWNGPNDPNNTISMAGQTALTNASKEFANNYNPTWGQKGSPLGIQAKPTEIAAVQELQKLVGDTAMQKQITEAGLMTQAQIQDLKQANQIYENYISQIRSLTGSARYAAEQELYSVMNTAAAKPQAGPLAYLLNILAKAPTK